MSLGPGAVWSMMHDFRKGEGLQKKFFVILCEHAGHIVVALTTSRGAKHYAGEDRFTGKCGCKASPGFPAYRLEPNEESCFPVKTWVQFDNLQRFTRADLLERCERRALSFELELEEERCRAVLRCATHSDDGLTGHEIAAIKLVLKGIEQRQRERAEAAKRPPSYLATLRQKLKAMDKTDAEFCDVLGIKVKSLDKHFVEPVSDAVKAEATAALELLSG